MHASVCRKPALLPSKLRLAARLPPRSTSAARQPARRMRCPPVAANLYDFNMLITTGLVLLSLSRHMEHIKAIVQLKAAVADLQEEVKQLKRNGNGTSGQD
ncbi:histidine kinase [Chlorella sorokiniana]|uniref:Histidine kinase n=1 Tax=Chlorella sorokiniana TaxID=3076 RepID=A0A2P6TZ24_CHLSO|nr:histidine kinase [Chlorella sorokiniana]|eukprot:PRW59311.1 histidine kinase [Chlorella sorokiniana]